MRVTTWVAREATQVVTDAERASRAGHPTGRRVNITNVADGAHTYEF